VTQASGGLRIPAVQPGKSCIDVARPISVELVEVSLLGVRLFVFRTWLGHSQHKPIRIIGILSCCTDRFQDDPVVGVVLCHFPLDDSAIRGQSACESRVFLDRYGFLPLPESLFSDLLAIDSLHAVHRVRADSFTELLLDHSRDFGPGLPLHAMLHDEPSYFRCDLQLSVPGHALILPNSYCMDKGIESATLTPRRYEDTLTEDLSGAFLAHIVCREL
jgi:hypothetical protein